MTDWLAVIILGIIEGITEFLPISSTGHLLLAEQWLGSQGELFVTVIQCGTVLAVLLAFSSRMQDLARAWRQAQTQLYLLKLTLAFGITGAGGLLLKKLDFKLPETAAPVAWAILIGGVLILIIEQWLKDKPLKEDITWTIAAAIGLAQLAAAVFPGTSRSGATILVALACGLRRPLATEFSFLLGVPTLLAAGALQTYSAHKDGQTVDWPMVLLGALVAAVTAFIAVKWLLRYVQSHTFVAFGWYRIGLGILILLFVPEGTRKPPQTPPAKKETVALTAWQTNHPRNQQSAEFLTTLKTHFPDGHNHSRLTWFPLESFRRHL